MPTHQALAGGSGAVRVAYRLAQAESGPLRLRDGFDRNLLGANALSRATAAAATRWGIWWVASPAARAAFLGAGWLLCDDQPVGALALDLDFDPTYRELTIIIRDAGCTPPTARGWGALRADLYGCGAYPDVLHLPGSGRVLLIVMRVRPPYRVRLTWDRERFSQPHPRHSFEYYETELEAHQAGNAALRGIGCGGGAPQGALLEVEYQGPGDAADAWSSLDAADRLPSNTGGPFPRPRHQGCDS